jgi:2-alkenal reductase
LITNEDAVLSELYDRVNPAVVNIVTYTREGGVIQPSGQGSGFVFDQDGHIVTNSHVVHGSSAVEVGFASGETFEAEIIGQDLHSDLAVIKVESLPDGVQALAMADFDSIDVGQTVVAIGNPFGLGGTLTRGIVSALGRNIPALTSFSIPQAIQTDAPINPGNSGGPLLNLRGEVIGVNAQIETDGTSRTNSGIGYAIPVSIVNKVVPSLISDGEFVWGWLGIRGGNVTPTQVKAMDLSVNKGAYISEVIDGGPSDKAGLRGSDQQIEYEGRFIEIGGDIITAVDGQLVSTFDDILIYIALLTQPGQTIELSILRDNKPMQASVELEPRPNEVQAFP